MNKKLVHTLIDKYMDNKSIFLCTYFVDKDDTSIKYINLIRIVIDRDSNEYRFIGEFQSKRGKRYKVTLTPDDVDTISAFTIEGKNGFKNRVLECITIDGDFDEIFDEFKNTCDEYDYSRVKSKRSLKINLNPENVSQEE